MATLTRLFRAIETFAEYAYKKPIWYLWTIFVGGCVMFWISYQLADPDEQARLEKSITERVIKIQDGERLCSLNEQLITEAQASTKVLRQFLTIVEGIVDSVEAGNRQQQIQENYDLALEARKRAEILNARVKGIELRVPMYNQEVRMYEPLLATEISMLKMIEDFCAAYLKDDVKKFVEQVHQSAIKFPTLLEEMETALARQQSLKLEQESRLQLDSTENVREMAQARIHRLKGHLQFPVLAFPALYAITIYLGVSNFWRSHGAAQRRKRVVARPKRRGKKR